MKHLKEIKSELMLIMNISEVNIHETLGISNHGNNFLDYNKYLRQLHSLFIEKDPNNIIDKYYIRKETNRLIKMVYVKGHYAPHRNKLYDVIKLLNNIDNEVNADNKEEFKLSMRMF